MASLEQRVTELEKHEREQYAVDTAQSEQIKTLFASVKVLRNVVYVFSLIMLLALIWGALGPEGFNAVTNAAKPKGLSGLMILTPLRNAA